MAEGCAPRGRGVGAARGECGAEQGWRGVSEAPGDRGRERVGWRNLRTCIPGPVGRRAIGVAFARHRSALRSETGGVPGAVSTAREGGAISFCGGAVKSLHASDSCTFLREAQNSFLPQWRAAAAQGKRYHVQAPQRCGREGGPSPKGPALGLALHGTRVTDKKRNYGPGHAVVQTEGARAA